MCLKPEARPTETKIRTRQTLTFRVILQGDTHSLLGARETAVNLINLNWGLSGLFQPLAILPDILI